MVDGIKAGDTISVSLPKNEFELKPSPAGYTLIAGGIGITPILSMARHLKSTGAGKFRLYYLTRSKAATAFLEELSGPEFRGATSRSTTTAAIRTRLSICGRCWSSPKAMSTAAVRAG